MKRKYILVILAALILVLSLTACGELKTIGNLGDDFMSALSTGDHATSYQMLSADIQAEIGGEAGWSEWAAIRSFDKWKFNSNSIENNTAQLEGTAELDKEEYKVVLIFDKISDEWKITGISFE